MRPIAPHYLTLLKFDGKNHPKIIGDLAKSWTILPNGFTYTFKLHDGVKFHDGSPLKSEDVKPSYELIANSPAGVVSVRKAWYADVDAIDTPDATTVVFKLKGLNISMLTSFQKDADHVGAALDLTIEPFKWIGRAYLAPLNKAAIVRLVVALLLEQNDEWAVTPPRPSTKFTTRQN